MSNQANLQLNETHDIHLRSWVTSANDSSSDFPIQNLPFGVFRKKEVPKLSVLVSPLEIRF